MTRVRNSFLILLPGFGVIFAIFCVIEFFFGLEQGILPSFLVNWHLQRAFQFTTDWLGPLLASSIFLSFGLFKATSLSQKSTRSTSPVLMALLAGFICAGTVVFLRPLSTMAGERIREASELFNEELRQGQRSAEAGEWARTAQALDVLSSIAPKDKRYLELRLRYASRVTEPQAVGNPQATPDAPQSARAADMGANEAYLEALSSYQRGDYYQAHSLATRAARMDASRLDAVRLAAQAWEEIGALEEGSQEKAQRETARLKREAYQTLRSGDPVKAYSLFLSLSERAPADRDVQRYLKESLEGMRGVAFFIDEIGKLSRLPRSRNVFFRVSAAEDKNTSPGGGKPSSAGNPAGGVRTSFLAASSVYTGTETAYFLDFEYISVKDGKVVEKIAAPYAKLRAGRVLMACYDRENPSRSWKPVYLAGGGRTEADNILNLNLSMKDLAIGTTAASDPRAAGALALADLCMKAFRLGIDPSPFLREGLMRIHSAVALLLTALFSYLVGRRYSYYGSGRPFMQALIVAPLSFISARLALEVAAWASSAMALMLEPRTGSPAEIGSSVLIFSLVQLAFVGCALILIAGHREKHPA
jgi:tetratricopeptide (TPR) repeat protein